MAMNLRMVMDRFWSGVILLAFAGLVVYGISLLGCVAPEAGGDMQTGFVNANDVQKLIDANVGLFQHTMRDQNFDPWTMRGLAALAALPSVLLAWYMRGRLKLARGPGDAARP